MVESRASAHVEGIRAPGPASPRTPAAGRGTPGAGPGTPTTRERILDAALARFAQRGVEATSLDVLAGDVGVRKQTILYWFDSKEHLLLAVVDHTVARVGAQLSLAARRPAGTDTAGGRPGAGRVRSERDLVPRVRAVVDAVFRLGRTDPALLAVVREVARLGPPASEQLGAGLEPFVESVTAAMGWGPAARGPVRTVLLAAGARVLGFATEAEVRADLGLAPDLAWLRARRRALLDELVAGLRAATT